MANASPWPQRPASRRRRWAPRLQSSRGAELVEMALATPLLLLLVVGAWDFGSAFLLQDKMTNAAREAARLSASNSLIGPAGTSCASSGTPCVIVASIDALKLYMSNAGIDLTCVDSAAPSNTTGLQYTYACGSVPGLQVVINRGAVVDVGSPPVPLPSTQVSFTYPVTWWLGRLLPKGFFPSTLTTIVTMRNLVF